LMPNSRASIIPEAGHLVHFEQADAFHAVLRQWLSRLELEKTQEK